jgi:hypothetical protein
MKETLMEFATREANDNEKHGRFNLDYQDGIFYGIQEGAKWQKESMDSEQELGQKVGQSVQVPTRSMYSEREVLAMLLMKHDGLSPEYVLEQFKRNKQEAQS